MNAYLQKKCMRLFQFAGTIFLTFNFSTVNAGPPPFPKDLSTPNILKPTSVIGGKFGSALGQFNEPHGVDFGSDGRVLITDKHNNRVCLFDKALKIDRCIIAKRSGLNSPTTVKWSGSTRFLVADTGNRRVVELDTEGNILRSSSSDVRLKMSEPTGVTTLGKRVFVADRSSQQIHILDADLRLIRSVGKPGDANGEFVDPSSVTSNERDLIFVADSYNNRVQIFDIDGKFVGKFGDWGSFTGLLANPSSVYYSSSTIFVTDLINHRIQAYDERGQYLLQWGRHPLVNHEGNGRLHYPEQIAVNRDGDMAIVCEPFEHRCQVFDIKNATEVVQVNDQAWWDKNGNFHYGARPGTGGGLLAISEPDTHSVLVFDIRNKEPRFLARIGGQGRELGSMVKPSGVALSADGSTLYVSDSGNFRIESYDLKTALAGTKMNEGSAPQKLIRATSTMSLDQQIQSRRGSKKNLNKLPPSPVIEPSALKFSPSGTILMADPVNGRVLELGKDLQPIRYFIAKPPASMPGFRPNDIAFSPSGDRVYIVDFYHSRIGIFDREGKFISKFGSHGSGSGQFIHAFGVTTSKKGDVYVSDEALNKISRFDRNGTLISSWGSWGAAPGQFYKPKGLTYDAERDRIIVADFGNHRAQIFDPSGNFITTFGIGQGYVPYLLSRPPSGPGTLENNNGGSTPSNGGNFVVDYRSSTSSFAVGKDYKLSFNVRKYDGAAIESSIKIRVTGVMPSHYHGLAQKPIIQKSSDGTWLAEGVNFHMPGYWQIFFDIDNGIVVERAQIDVMVH